MSLFDGQPLTLEEVRERMIRDTGTIKKLVTIVRNTGRTVTRSRTLRHKPWWKLLGPGPNGAICQRCKYLVGRGHSKTYYKCGAQTITRGAGTDIRLHDQACRLFKEAAELEEAAT